MFDSSKKINSERKLEFLKNNLKIKKRETGFIKESVTTFIFLKNSTRIWFNQKNSRVKTGFIIKIHNSQKLSTA